LNNKLSKGIQLKMCAVGFHFGVLMSYIYLSVSKLLQILLLCTYTYNKERFLRSKNAKYYLKISTQEVNNIITIQALLEYINQIE
jgi:hypothetical protein